MSWIQILFIINREQYIVIKSSPNAPAGQRNGRVYPIESSTTLLTNFSQDLHQLEGSQLYAAWGYWGMILPNTNIFLIQPPLGINI